MNEQQEILAKQTFHEEMLKLFKRTAKEVKYKPTRRLDMINKYGGYEAAIKMLPTDSNTFDFTLLWEQERLDLSIEALVTKERYQNLFPPDVVTFCQSRLDAYNYAPKKLETVPDDIDDFLSNLLVDIEPQKETVEEVIPTPHTQDQLSEQITQEKWYALFTNSAVFTASNKDLILKMYALGERGLTLAELANLEGYSQTYPFYDVLIALCKRIKSTLKLEMPLNPEGKIDWWSVLCQGSAENKKEFLWFIRKELTQAIAQLMEEGTIPQIEVIYVAATTNHTDVQKAVEIAEVVDDTIAEEVLSSTLDTPPEEVDTNIESTEVLPLESRAEENANVCVPAEPIEKCEERNVPEECLLERVKAACIEYFGPVCDICGFDFGYTYGHKMDGFIHVHCLEHAKEKEVEALNPQEDLMPICSNCQTVMMSKEPAYTVDEIKEMLKENQ